jgi:hypothetical protein
MFAKCFGSRFGRRLRAVKDHADVVSDFYAEFHRRL